jgi:hypothetical protein
MMLPPFLLLVDLKNIAIGIKYKTASARMGIPSRCQTPLSWSL